MRKRAMLVHACNLMTGGANIGLRCCLEDGIASHVTFVAAGARDLVECMGARMPARTKLLLMTGAAHAVLNRHGCAGVGAEANDVRTLLPFCRLACMRTARAVAGFALELT